VAIDAADRDRLDRAGLLSAKRRSTGAMICRWPLVRQAELLRLSRNTLY